MEENKKEMETDFIDLSNLFPIPASVPKQQKLIEGKLIRTIFYNQDTYFFIGLLDNKMKVKGNLPHPELEKHYKFFDCKGEYSEKYRSTTYAFRTFSSEYPKEKNAVISYIIENIKGVGQKTAELLWESFKEQTIQTIKENPEKVSSIKGITPDIANTASIVLKAGETTEAIYCELYDFLKDINIKKSLTEKLIKKYGSLAVIKLKENPYILVNDINGVGFPTADHIATSICKIPYDSSERIQAGIVYTLSENENSGNTCIEEKLLIGEVSGLLGVGKKKAKECLIKNEYNRFAYYNDYVYKRKTCQQEKENAEKIKTLIKKPLIKMETIDLSNCLPEYRKETEEIINKASKSNFFILTGAAGTGKTTIIKRIIDSFPKNINIALAAPTGKAAKRMTETTGHEAKTIHRLLDAKYYHTTGGFSFVYNSEKQLEYEVIIIDEASMITNKLLWDLLQAISKDTKVVFVGDTFQLPAIGTGNVLSDMITSGVVPVGELKTIKRQKGTNNTIIDVAHDVKKSRIKLPLPTPKDGITENNLYFIDRSEPKDIIKTILYLMSVILPEKFSIKSEEIPNKIQVLTAMRKTGLLSVKSLNSAIQEKINKNPPVGELPFRLDDKVMQISNNYDLGIMNGDIGYIAEINEAKKEYTVEFKNPSRIVQIGFFKNNLQLAYACTVHKYQGSESDIVILPSHKSMGHIVTCQKWLYTAITRASKFLVVVGDTKYFKRVVANNREDKRVTMLGEFLKGE